MNADVLSDLNPFDLFDQESERLEHFFSQLTENDWNRPSRCAGWSVKDVLGHLAGEEEYNLACVNSSILAFYQRLDKEGIQDFHGFNEWSVDQQRSRSFTDVLAEWKDANSKRATRCASEASQGSCKPL